MRAGDNTIQLCKTAIQSASTVDVKSVRHLQCCRVVYQTQTIFSLKQLYTNLIVTALVRAITQ